MRRARQNTLERRKIPRPLLKVAILLLLLVIVTLNSFVIWIFGHVALQCPNKKDMVMKANDVVEIDGEDEEEKMSPLENTDNIYVEYLVERGELVVRRALNIHVKVDDLDGQRKNVFHEMSCS